MRWKGAWLLLLLAGCDEGDPPFDELPLRDALRADPAAVAALHESARARLAARFEAARAGDVAVDPFPDDSSAAPPVVAADVDRIRQHRQAEPLLLGLVRQGAAWPIQGDGHLGGEPLPVLDGPPASATAAIESRALAGRAGAELRLLLAASGAQHLQRVLGWPAGAVALEETIYVNASWLVALAPAERPNLDGGLTSDVAASSVSVVSNPAARAELSHAPSAGAIPSEAIKGTQIPRYAADAGAPPSTWTQPLSEPSAQPVPSDGCQACADSCASYDGQSCESADTGGEGDDSSDGSSDGCDSSAQDDTYAGSDGCGSDSGDGATTDSCAGDSGEVDASGCQLGPRPRNKRSRLSAWLFAPLGYLLFRRRP